MSNIFKLITENGIRIMNYLVWIAGITLSMKTLTLLKWKDRSGQAQKLRLLSRVMSKWKQLGTLLGLSDGGELDGWDSQYRGDAAECCMKVMQHWLGGGSEEDYPPTWEGLCTLLEDAELTEVAVKLKEAVTAA